MAAEHQYFYEDEVYRINKKGNIEFGMVLENSELVSSDENSDEEGGRMRKGHIRVAWHPTGVEEIIPERKVHLADRSLMPGDVVRRMIKGKDTQRGYCRDIKVTACVQVVGTKQVIPSVKSENLVPLEEFATDIAACLDSWVGGIKTVHSKLLIQCSDGSRCIINDIEASFLEDFNEKRDCECEFRGNGGDFYPGQTLWGPLHCLEEAEWIHCTKELKAQRTKANKIVKVMVEEVQTDSVGVHWQCRAYSKDGAGAEKEQPKFLVQGDDLKRLRLLNVFEPCTLQVGDRNFYTFREVDTVVMKEHWRRSQRDFILAGNSVTNGPASTIQQSKTLSPSKNRSQDILANPAEPTNQVTMSHPNVQGTVGNMHSVMVLQPVVPTVEVTNGNPTPGSDLNAGGDHLEDWDTEDTASMSDTASISSGCSSVGSQGKKKRGPALMTKVLKKKKLRRTRKRAPPVALQPGQRVVVETLSTSSIADVVWQDGSVEYGIASTQLYPIHHLDDQEFFPGDFVIENKEESCMRVYGVVQSVDHAGRTATVKWFKTYTSQEEPCPAMLEENEVSVYDLKDHPDFQYRPGTVVIRVANFEGEDANCTAGQVLDNYPEGMVRVWWVDGHVSMSWPQDLYKVGEYDSDEGELWDDGSSDASWETESEDCFIADDICPEEDLEEVLKPKLAANIEKARIAMSRLEEIFTQNPSLQTTSVMRQLLDVYKDCRYLDKLMGTSFFHESHFQGLLERVRERGRANVAQRVADQVSRLFHQSDVSNAHPSLLTCTNSHEDNTFSNKVSDPLGSAVIGSGKHSEVGVVRKQEGVIQNVSEVSALEVGLRQSGTNQVNCVSVSEYSAQRIGGLGVTVDERNVVTASAVNKDRGSGSIAKNDSLPSREILLSENLVNLERHVITAANNHNCSNLHESDDVLREIMTEPHCATTAKSSGSIGQRNNGNYSNNKLHAQTDERGGGVASNTAKHNGCYGSPVIVSAKGRHSTFANSPAPIATASEPHNSRRLSDVSGASAGTAGSSPLPLSLVSNSHVCVKLCSLIKAQLVKAHGEVTRRFGGSQGLMTLSDAFNTRSPVDSGSHKDENEVEEDACKIDVPVGKKRGRETHVSAESRRPERAWDTPETTRSEPSTAAEQPLLSEKVKDGLKDMFHALSRLGGAQVVPSQNQPVSAKSAEAAEKEESSAASTATAAVVAPVEEKKDQVKANPVQHPGEEVADESCGEGFSIMDSAPSSHKFKLTMFQPVDPQNFFRTVRKEIKLLRSSLPPGIWVKGFEDRMDLYSVMIRGPEKTPYEDGLFFFDFQLSAEYPKAPPLCHYISYCSDRLNPNLYEDGKVCVSLLGTWSGKGTEVWTLHSNLLQVIVSIQGLILVSEPYFNEAGYEKQKGSQQGKENSRMYNEMAVLKLVQSLTKLIVQPPPVFQEEILQHFRQNAYKLLNRLETWLEISEQYNSTHPITPTTPTSFREMHGPAISNVLNAQLPEFPLIPASKGFCLTLRKTLVFFRDVLSSVSIREEPTS